MTPQEKARQTADKFKPQKAVASKEAIEPITDKTGMQQMDPELIAVMKRDAQKQTEEDGGLQPWLKVFDSSRSTYTLRNGDTPHHGWLFYQPEEIELEEAYAHILYISDGFRTEGMKNEDGTVKFPYQHIVSGVLIHEAKLKLFWMTIAGGARLNRLWEFRKEYQKVSRSDISRFAVVVHMKAERVVVKDQKGNDRVAQVVDFKFVKNEQGQFDMVSNTADYLFLQQKEAQQRILVQEYIDRKEIKDGQPIHGETISTPAVEKLGPGVTVKGDTVELDTSVPAGTEEVDPDTIPF